MDNENIRQQQEYEFVMEGITTRMQIALEKMSESNRMMADNARMLADNNRHQGKVMIAVLIIVILGFIINNIIMINHINDIRNNAVSEAVSVNEEIPELGTRTPN